MIKRISLILLTFCLVIFLTYLIRTTVKTAKPAIEVTESIVEAYRNIDANIKLADSLAKLWKENKSLNDPHQSDSVRLKYSFEKEPTDENLQMDESVEVVIMSVEAEKERMKDSNRN